ncbi:kyphoscoliosis peptidase-like [Saccostrea cucullata]|uniref:kyphoscoliosis peptidase-like n=1 Tax=Saccostrea cuccullata TaxID=36930 RepID=UPI002ED50B56
MGSRQSAQGYTEGEDQPLPQPRPPRKLKRHLVKREDTFKSIDDYALKTPRSATVSVAKLATHLSEGATSDLEKIRAFYRWITENIRYDTRPDFHDRDIDTSGAAVLRMRSSVCIGYANLFSDLCRECRIPVKIISGYSKSFNYDPEMSFSTDKTPEHAWNAVYLNGDWQFVECTWGAGSRDDRGNFVKNFSDFHFLTEPKHFIVTHFPYMDSDMSKSQTWQLLPKPLTLEVFNKRLKGFTGMYRWKIKPLSHPDGVTNFSNKIELTMGYPKSSYFFVMARLSKKLSARDFDQHALVENMGGNKVRIRVAPPERGTYILKLFGRNDPKVEELSAVANYVLKCEETGDSSFAFPKHQGPFGPYHDSLEAGFHSSTGKNAVLESRNGKLDLQIKTTKKVEAIAKLEHATKNLNPNDNYVLLERDKGKLCVKAKFPSKGYYKLSIFTKNENADTYSPRIAYLVFCSEDHPNCEPFPKVFPQTTQFECRLLSPVTCELKTHAQVKFRFSSPSIVQALLHDSPMEKKGNIWEGTMKTPGPGERIQISASDQKGSKYWRIYEFSVM